MSEELELITRGRRSGKDHRVRLWYAHEGDVLWLRTEGTTDWHRNLRAHPEARVILDGREYRARYEPSADRDADLKRIVSLWRAKYGAIWVQDWFVERGREPVKLRLTDASRDTL